MKFNEEFPGGIGIGLTLPGGYINGATTESVSKILTKVDEDEIFEEFLDEYFSISEETTTNMSETKQQSINDFVEYVSKRLNLKEIPKINLMDGNDFGNIKSSLGGYNPETKEIVVATEGRLTADILRTIAHEMVHRKQDELGFIKDSEKDGADGSPIENQAHAVAGILMREYGRINKQIYNEDINDMVIKEKFEISEKELTEIMRKSLTKDKFEIWKTKALASKPKPKPLKFNTIEEDDLDSKYYIKNKYTK